MRFSLTPTKASGSQLHQGVLGNLCGNLRVARSDRADSSAQVKVRHMRHIVSLIGFGWMFISGCSNDDASYTLYRNSVTDESMRAHVATFDASDGHNYNMRNCQIAQELFQQQPGVKTKFWCEKGRFKK